MGSQTILFDQQFRISVIKSPGY